MSENENGGRKFDNGKPRTDLISSAAILELAKVLEFGARKYDPWNWASGIKYSRIIGAALRHLLAWKDGEDQDPETGLSHVAHAMCNLMFLLDYLDRQRSDLDDRRPLDTRKKKA